MLRIVAAWIVGVSFSTLALAQQTAGPKRLEHPDNPARQADLARDHKGYQAFLKRNGAGWFARFDEESGLPTMIAGVGLPVARAPRSLAEARLGAEAALSAEADLWQVPLAQLSLADSVKSGPLYAFTWKQAFGGVEVWGARVQIQVHEAGRVAALSSMAVPLPEGFARPTMIPAIQAQSLVMAGKVLLARDSVLATDLVIHPNPKNGKTDPRYAYVVSVSQPSKQVFERVFVDAETGAILEVENRLYDSVDVKGKVTAKANPGLSGLDPAVELPIEGASVTVSGVGTAITNNLGDYTITSPGSGGVGSILCELKGPYYAVTDLQGPNLQGSLGSGTPVSGVVTANFLLNDPPDEFGTAQASGAYHFMKIYNYLKGLNPAFVGYPQQGVIVNLTSICNAYYEGGGHTINFYNAGGSCVNTAFSTVIYHEFGHGADDYYGGILSGSLTEALADICSLYKTGQPICGQDFYGPGTYVRTGENNTKWPAQGCGGEPHCVGETYMGFAWQIYKALKLSMGDAPGVAQAEKIVMGTLPLNNIGILDAVTQVFLLDDNDGNLANGTPHFIDLANCATLKGFPLPPLQLLAVVHTNHPDTFSQTQPYPIYASVTATAPVQMTSGYVDYNVSGGSTISVPMAATGNPNQWLGSIPPQVGPALVSYTIRVVDQFGNSQKYPPGDDSYRFAVGKKTILLNENFESGAPGFTHAAVGGGTDNWNVGQPQFAGTNPYDPTAAYSGTKCYGNDLQLVASDDGLYDYGTENFLDTPAINATGKSGIHLRFRRWLTVEKGQNDKAFVQYGTNTTFWTNPTATDLMDTTWTLQDFTVPQADGQAAAKFRWRLKSDLGIEYGGWNVDDVQVYALEGTPVINLNITTNTATPQIGQLLQFDFQGTPGAFFQMFASLGPGPTPLDGYGVIGVDLGTLGDFWSAQLDGTGHYSLPLPLPYAPPLVGLKLYWVAAASKGTSLVQISNSLSTVFTQ